MKVIQGLLLASTLLFFACSGDAAHPGETGSAASAEEVALDPTATPSDPQPTPTTAPPTPTPGPSPTPTPIPTEPPIFTRADMPAKAVSEATITLWGAATPTDAHPWTGFGHSYDSTVGLSVPIVWSLPDDAAPEYELLPLPPGSDSGNAWYGMSTLGGQLAAGRIFTDDYGRAAYWFRSDTDEWQLDATFAPDVLSPDSGESQVRNVAGGDSWVMLRIAVESPTEIDEDGDPVTSQRILLSRDLETWEVVTLPGVTAEDWFFGIHAFGDHGLIVAQLDDDEAPASRIFATADAGVSWQDHDLDLVDDAPATIFDVIRDNGEWFAVGAIGTDDEREPAIFSINAEGRWQAQRPAFTFDATDPFEMRSLQSVRWLDTDTLVAVADTDPGSQTFTSTDGINWTHDPSLWLNQHDEEPESTIDFSRFSGDFDAGPVLATRAWAAPVWLTADGIQEIDPSPFDRIDRDVVGIFARDDGFVAVTNFERDGRGLRLWRSPDGLTWEFWKNDPTHRAERLQDLGDAILSYGTGIEGFATLRVYAATDRTAPINEILGASGVRITTDMLSAPSAGRNLVATTIRDGDTTNTLNRFAFVDLSTRAQIDSFPGPASGAVRAVCPDLYNGLIPVLLNDDDSVGSSISVWADRDDPQVLPGKPASGQQGFPNAILIGCSRLGLGLAAVGVSCSDAATADSAYSIEECRPALWTTEDGLLWQEHPGSQTLEAAGVQFPSAITPVGPGALLVGTPDDSSDGESLWLVSPTAMHEVPLDGSFNLRRVAANAEHVLFATSTSIFSGSIGDLVERTLEGDNLAEWQDLEASMDDRLAELVSQAQAESTQDESTQAAEATSVPAPAPTTPPASAPAPSQPAPTPVPPPTAVPAPTTPPASSGALPVCNPGDLTTTGSCRCSGGRLYDDGGQCKIRCRSNEQSDGFGGCTRADGSQVDSGAGSSSGGGSGSTGEVIITTTLVCETTTDPQTGAVTETCEVVNE